MRLRSNPVYEWLKYQQPKKGSPALKPLQALQAKRRKWRSIFDLNLQVSLRNALKLKRVQMP
ncbi:hypothetical protein A3A70_02805 [candidate division WWE3 bacterium RIFCSPLOWO2_01_FULL_42_11]|uniref:Transposase n=1 Tax=candidate division WWE3 bacterium RIFCSPLOWO2_01_FULL_42_11 TaxID=1802627 RepID=A0A1F4VLB6_UNCKA|nr:MAG: hypothetical protein A3A70_02805 [candidate division WWE3 bacterium RIFCSPLOWO2_01_FULL_42_11]